MSPANSDQGDIRLVQHFPVPARVFFALAGAAALIMAPYELWRGVWPINAFTPFFGIVVAGAVFVGGFVLIGAIFGYNSSWTLRDDELVIEEWSHFGRRKTQLRRGDILATEICEHEYEDGPPVWSLVLQVKNGKALNGPSFFGTRRKADAFRAALHKRLAVA